MMKKNLYLIVIFFILSGCGFKPVLTGSNYDFEIKVKSASGEETINSKIKKQLKNLDGITKSFDAILNSKLTKNTISKDTKGDPSILEISITLSYKLIEKGNILVDKRLTQRSNYNNISDKFELRKTEEILIDNMVENLVSNIISDASNLSLNP